MNTINQKPDNTIDIEESTFNPSKTVRNGIYYFRLKALDDAGISYNAEDILETSMDLPKNLDMIKSYLISHPDVDALVCLGSVSTPAGAMALQELEYKPGDVQWTGFDLSPQAEEGIRAGYGAINVDECFNHGYFGAMILYIRAKHGEYVGNLPIFNFMVDQSNIDLFSK